MDRIGHYTIVSELGRGGMGIVYKAHEDSLNRFVAIKVLGEHLTEDPAHIERFVREAKSAASLNHPNIVQIYAISEEDGKHFFVMEYVTGRSLSQILRTSGPLEPEQAARIALQTASGLRAAHEQGIIHRDIKPANLLIDDRGLVKIADFGLALMSGAVSRLTATGMFMGTPGYLSPEQCLDQEIDHRTDIYSLGVTIFEALAGKIPFTADSPLALLRQIIEVEPPDLGELKPDLDPDLRVLVARMMAKDRDLRVASCAELVGGLEKFLEKRGASGNLVERLAGSTAGPPPPPPPTGGDVRLETDPTMQVPSGTAEAAPPPPPAAPARAADTEIPVVETSPVEETPKAGGSKLALAAALVVVLGIIAVATAGVVAWRSGFLQTVMGKSEKSPPIQAALSTGEESSDLAAGIEPEPEEESAVAAGDQAGASTEVVPTPEPSAEAESRTAAAGSQAPSSGTRGLTSASGSTQPKTRPEPARQAAPPPLPTVPPPEGTVVIAVGEQLLAGEAEAFVEAGLARAGIALIDENTVPGLATLIGSGEVPRPGEVQAMLRPYARNLVMVRIEYLGERPLTYMGQRDVAFQARVTVVPIDVQSGSAIEAPTRFRVEYTHLNVERVVEKEFRRPTYRVVQLLGAE